LAYRQAGGYAQFGGGRLLEQHWPTLRAGQTVAVQQGLAQAGQAADTPEWWRVFLAKVQLILNGARDPALADDPALSYNNAAQLLLLIERLGGAG
jgi:hypothetical protein